jgi:hypothetical protein
MGERQSVQIVDGPASRSADDGHNVGPPSEQLARFATEDPGMAGTDADQSLIEQAVGALMGHGITAEAAHVELAVRAESSHWTVIEEARDLLLPFRGTVPLR